MIGIHKPGAIITYTTQEVHWPSVEVAHILTYKVNEIAFFFVVVITTLIISGLGRVKMGSANFLTSCSQIRVM